MSDMDGFTEADGFIPDANFITPYNDRSKGGLDPRTAVAYSFQVPGAETHVWRDGQRGFVEAVFAKIRPEGEERSLLDIRNASEDGLTARQVKASPYVDVHWTWIGAREQDGRPVMRMHRHKWQARRIIWSIFRGGTPNTRLVVRVICGRKDCVNPMHAELMGRGSWQKKRQG